MKRYLALLLTALAVPAFPAFAQENVVNVYSARHYPTDEQLYERFTEQTGIEVNIIEAGADELIERIRSEGRNSPADVIITVDAGRLWRAQQAGILAPVTSETLEERIPENMRDPEGEWFGLTQRVRAIFYNVNTVDPAELSTYEDLAGDQWEGRVCVRSSNNIYNQSLVASLIEANGAEATQEWANGFVENFARPPQGGDTDQLRAVAAGECDVAISNHYYYARLVDSTDPADQEVVENVAIFFPNQEGRGAHVNISGAGVVTTAPHPENAVRFIEYLTTPEAQEVFARGNNEFPVVADVEASQIARDLGEFQADDVDVVALGENNPEAVQIMDRAGWR